ncbi:MAG: 30S ribosomal protein S11 [Candidatus Niyogibacteria bacterium]|nr:MAG: 30S ribosomal protein S11 [Candidatus Niyogibacteria bacterium]
MGKKRVIKKTTGGVDHELRARAVGRLPKKKLEKGVLNIQATYNNTMLTLTDEKGNAIIWASSGSLGFKGARKGTPYAASKVAELVAEKAKMIGLKSVNINVKGVGAGRESAVRSFLGQNINLDVIRDVTPIPHNGPRPPKPRRV